MGEDSRTALRVGSLGNGDAHGAAPNVSEDHPALSLGSMRAAPAVGTLIGNYVVERVIGSGGMGIVLAGRHAQLGELAAIKLLHPKAAKDEVQRERFVREARATVRIKSEHVVRVLDAGTDAVTGAPYIVMEYLEGRDLGRMLERGALAVTPAVDLMMQICEAVAAAHALGIIHRDLKPSNFFVTERRDGRTLVKVLDFGISKASEQNGVADPRLTETQAVFGSPTYMSPEQIRSSKNVDPRSDVWSLGVALFEMLTGKLPFVADNVPGLLASVIADAPFRVSVFAPEVPPELEAVVLGCLEKDASRRVGSAIELALLLAPFASPEAQQLATSIERHARPGSKPSSRPSFRPSAAPAIGPTGTHPLVGPAAAAAAAGVPSSSSGSGPGALAFGNTGDLSATGPTPRPARRSGFFVALLGVIAVVVLGGGGMAAMAIRSRAVAPTAPAAPAAPAAEPPTATATATAHASATAESPTATASNEASGKRPPRAITSAHSALARPAAVAATSAPATTSNPPAPPAAPPSSHPAGMGPADDRF